MNQRVRRLRERVVGRALGGAARAPEAMRRAAFDNIDVDPRVRQLVSKVARHAWKITGEDVGIATSAGVSEDEIFELAVCAALGQATRQLHAGLAALDAAAGHASQESPARTDGPGATALPAGDDAQR